MAMDDQRVLGVGCSRLDKWYLSATDRAFLAKYDPLIQPALIRHEIPLSNEAINTISHARKVAADIVAGRDPRVLVIVGPCSIHSPELAVEYASRLKEIAKTLDGLFIVMRAYL